MKVNVIIFGDREKVRQQGVLPVIFDEIVSDLINSKKR